ncbi:hypothetical protein AB0939_28140 [Streptomyces sp. NPDC006990]
MWMDCPACEGSGYDTLEFQIWCPDCGGGKVLEACDLPDHGPAVSA